MRNEFSIRGIAPVKEASDPFSVPRIALLNDPASPASAGPPANRPVSAANTGPPPPIFLNPALRLEPSLGLVVIEFRNSSGTVTDSIPTERQLEAYKQHARLPPEPATSASTRVPASAPAERAVGPPDAAREMDAPPAGHTAPFPPRSGQATGGWATHGMGGETS